MPSPTALATGYAAARVLGSAALVVAPQKAGRRWIGPAADGEAAQVAVEAAGVRDVVLAAGALAAGLAGDARALRACLAATAVVDAADVLGMARHQEGVPQKPARGTFLVAGAAALTGTALVVALSR